MANHHIKRFITGVVPYSTDYEVAHVEMLKFLDQLHREGAIVVAVNHYIENGSEAFSVIWRK